MTQPRRTGTWLIALFTLLSSSIPAGLVASTAIASASFVPPALRGTHMAMAHAPARVALSRVSGRSGEARVMVVGTVALHGVPSLALSAAGFAPGASVLIQAFSLGGTPLDATPARADAAGNVVGALPIPLLDAARRYVVALTAASAASPRRLLAVAAAGPLRARAVPPRIWAALRRLNYWRAAVGAAAVALDPRLQLASDLHALYLDRNFDTPTCRSLGCGHRQQPGLPGFTGQWPSDRCAAAAYPWACGSEVLGDFASPSAEVDALVATVFHRTIILDPASRYVGIGSASPYLHHFVPIDPGAGPAPFNAPPWWTFPVNGQTDVPTTLVAEEPDPLLGRLPNAPHGDPITISFRDGADDVLALALRRITATGAEQDVPVMLVHAHNPVWAGTAWAIGLRPLCAASTYHVAATLRVGGRIITLAWSFRTQDRPITAPCA